MANEANTASAIAFNRQLIEHAKKILPRCELLHKALQRGDAALAVGILEDLIGIDPDTIARAFANNRELSLVVLAQRQQQFRNLLSAVQQVRWAPLSARLAEEAQACEKQEV